jgi:hypothetical protein
MRKSDEIRSKDTETGLERIQLFLQNRCVLFTISSVLVFIPVSYQMIFPPQPEAQNFIVSLCVLGIYGYAMVVADLIAEVVRRILFPNPTWTCEGVYKFIFIILSVFTLMVLYYAFGFDAMRDISLAFVALIAYWRRKSIEELMKKSAGPAG